MLKLLALLAAMTVALAFSSAAAHASCACQCIDGQMIPACTSPFDIPPICALRTCPFSVTPPSQMQPVRKACREVQVCNPYCQWNQVCI